MPSSPLHGKGNPIASAKTMEHHNAQPETDASLLGKTNDHANDAISQNSDEDEAEAVLSTNDDASDDYIPPTVAKNTKDHKKATHDKASKKSTDKRSTKSVSKLEREIKGLSIGGDALAEVDNSVVILPNRKLRQAAMEAGGAGAEYIPGKGEVDPGKKKKRCAGLRWHLQSSQLRSRQLGKKNIVTEDEVEEVVGAMEHRPLRKTVRRMGRAS
jgi:hypothetical protein